MRKTLFRGSSGGIKSQSLNGEERKLSKGRRGAGEKRVNGSEKRLANTQSDGERERESEEGGGGGG